MKPFLVILSVVVLIFVTSNVWAQNQGFDLSSLGANGIIQVGCFDTYYDGSNGILSQLIPLPTAASAMEFRVTGGINSYGSRYTWLASADGIDADGFEQFDYMLNTKYAGTYQGTPIGSTTGIDPALFGVFFSATGSAIDSMDYRTYNYSGITPDPRTLLDYHPAVNQPFYVGDGYNQNNRFMTNSDSYTPLGSIQTFYIPTGATYLLLGIGADPNMADNANAGESGTSFKVHIFDNSASAANWTGNSSGSWSNSNNWSNGLVPGASNNVIFNSTTTVNQITTLGDNQAANSLTFNASATTPITIAAGNAISVGSGGINVGPDTASDHTINADIALAAPQTWSVNGNRNLNVGGSISSATNSLTKSGSGTLTLTGTSVLNGPFWPRQGTIVIPSGGSVTANSYTSIGYYGNDNATLKVTGTGRFVVAGDLNVGDEDNSKGIVTVQDNAYVTTRNLYVGKLQNAIGILNQTGGTIQHAIDTPEWRIGGGSGTGDSNAQGTYNISGGSMDAGFCILRIGAYGKGWLNMSGGSISIQNWPTLGRFATGEGRANITGGIFNQLNADTRFLVGEQGTGELTISSTGLMDLTGGLRLGWYYADSPGNGTANLNTGGTILTSLVETNGGTSTFNFNGGTLKAKIDNTSFMQGLSKAFVSSGGAVVDTNGHNVTIAQPLLVASSGGVTGFSGLIGGDNYTSPPLVTVVGDGGGATAYATLDSLGHVNGIIIGNPGSGYTAASFIISPASGADGAGATANALVTANSGGGLTKNGSGTLTLTGTNTFNGDAQVNKGILQAGNNWALGSSARGTTITDGATLDINGFNLGAEKITVQGSGVDGNGAIINSNKQQGNAIRNVTLTGDVTFGGINTSTTSNGRWDIRGLSSTNMATLSTNGQAYNLTKVGSNQVSFVYTNVDPALGDINIRQGVLGFQRNTTSMGDPNKTVTVESGAALNFYDASNIMNKHCVLNGGTIWAESSVGGNNMFAGPITITSAGGIFDAGSAQPDGTPKPSAVMTLSGPITGLGGATKTGPGTVTITGNGSFAGPTNINAGTLKVNGSFSTSGSVSVNNSGTLSGTGTVGNVTVDSGGHIAPGDSGIGNLNVSSLSLNSGSVLDTHFNYQAFSPATPTQVTVTTPGALTINDGQVNLLNSLNNTTFCAPGTYTLAKYTGIVGGNQQLSVVNPLAGENYSFNYTGNSVNLNISIPHEAPPPPPQTFNPTERLAELKWDSATAKYDLWEPVPAGSLSGNVHIVVHGWKPGERSWVDSNGGSNARIWNDTSAFNDPNNPNNLQNLAASIKTAMPGDRVLVYSWIDLSATGGTYDFNTIDPFRGTTYAAESEINTDTAGHILSQELKAAYGSNSTSIQLIGHSHGAKVATIATLDLQQLNIPPVKQLTLFDSPDQPLIPAPARNNLDGYLQPIVGGKTAPTVFVDNYSSLTGRGYTGNLVNVGLDPPATLDYLTSAHGYPIGWYSKSAADPYAGVGLDWSPLTLNLGQSLQTNAWTQQWRDQFGFTDPTRELNLQPIVAPATSPLTSVGTTLISLHEDANVQDLGNGHMLFTKGSPAYWDTALNTTANDEAFQFTYQFLQPGEGDQLSVSIDGQLRFLVAGEYAGTGLQPASVDISDLTPGTHIMTIALNDYGSAPAQFSIGDFAVLSVPEPSILYLLASCGTILLICFPIMKHRRFNNF